MYKFNYKLKNLIIIFSSILCLNLTNSINSYFVTIEPTKISQFEIERLNRTFNMLLKRSPAEPLDYRKVEVGTLKISDNAKTYVNQVLDANRLSYGPFLQKFEKLFAKAHEGKFALISNSGTSSLQIAVQALKELHGWQNGDEIIVPAVTFVASSNVILHNNLVPVFVDVDQDFYELNPKLLEAKITPKTRAIMPVHLFGQPCDMGPIWELAKKYNLKIIEDSCETMLARYKGKMVGTLGDIGCFSTYVAHLLTTGVGGFSVTNNPEYAVMMRSLLNHGRDSIYITIDDDDDLSSEQLKEIIARRFSFVSIGHSFRVTEMEGALGVAQMEILPEIINKRRANAAYLLEKLQGLQEFMQLPATRAETEHSFMMFPMVLKNQTKVNLVNYLEKHGIETRDMLPLINQPIYQKLFKINVKDYPVADWINTNGFYIGCHQDLTVPDLDYVVRVLKSYFEQK